MEQLGCYLFTCRVVGRYLREDPQPDGAPAHLRRYDHLLSFSRDRLSVDIPVGTNTPAGYSVKSFSEVRIYSQLHIQTFTDRQLYPSPHHFQIFDQYINAHCGILLRPEHRDVDQYIVLETEASKFILV